MPPRTDPLKLDVQREVQGLMRRTTIPRRVQRLLCSVITCSATAATRV